MILFYKKKKKKKAETHPDLYEGYKKGCFGLKRTGKTFSRQNTDLILKQTIKANAARRLTCIIQFTISISSHQSMAPKACSEINN